MKQLISDRVKEMAKKWGAKEIYQMKRNKSLNKFEGIGDEFELYHPMIGDTNLGDVRNSVAMGAIVFNGEWKVPVEEFMDYSVSKMGKMSLRSAEAHKIWRNRFKRYNKPDDTTR